MGNEGAGLLGVVGIVLGLYVLYCLYTIARSTYLTRQRLVAMHNHQVQVDKLKLDLLRELVAQGVGAKASEGVATSASEHTPTDPSGSEEPSFTRASRGEAMWLPDPYSLSGLRWWDGEGWTDHTHE